MNTKSTHPRISVPSKAFLLGEYAVLFGHTALVAALPRKFTAEVVSDNKQIVHPESPAGILIKAARERGISIPSFSWAQTAPSGMGASTAEFAVVFTLLCRTEGIEKKWPELMGETPALSAWLLYRQLTEVPGGLSPSGADLMVQMLGDVIEFRNKPNEIPQPPQKTPRITPRASAGPLWIFSTTEKQPELKTKTHEHLASLELAVLAEKFGTRTQMITDHIAGLQAFEKKHWNEFGAALTRYATWLNELGLEDSRAQTRRERFEKLPGVWGAKGSGARLSDLFVVTVDESVGAEKLQKIREVAAEVGLTAITEGLGRVEGLHCLW